MLARKFRGEQQLKIARYLVGKLFKASRASILNPRLIGCWLTFGKSEIPANTYRFHLMPASQVPEVGNSSVLGPGPALVCHLSGAERKETLNTINWPHLPWLRASGFGPVVTICTNYTCKRRSPHSLLGSNETSALSGNQMVLWPGPVWSCLACIPRSRSRLRSRLRHYYIL